MFNLSGSSFTGIKKFSFLFILLFMVTACAGNEKLEKKANQHTLHKSWDEALAVYEELLKKEPQNISYITKYRVARFESAQLHYKLGKNFQLKQDFQNAIIEYQTSLTLDPTFKKAESALRKVRKQIDSRFYYDQALGLLQTKDLRGVKKALKKSLELDPTNKAAKEELSRIVKKSTVIMDGYELDLKSSENVNLQFKSVNVKRLFAVLSKLSGINFVFDSDVRDKPTSIYLSDATFARAMDIILMTNKLSRKVVNENTLIIYPTNPTKIKQYEELMVKVFYLSNFDAKKAVNMLRTMIKARDMFVHEELNAIVVRAKPDAIELAKKILEATDLQDAEVMLAVDIMEVNRNKALELGINLDPAKGTIGVPTNAATGLLTLDTLRDMASGDLLLSLPTGVVSLYADDLDANILANPRIRVKNHEKAKIHIGEKVPIVTVTTNVNGTTTENVQYEDVGIKLNVEPVITKENEIDLKISLEVSSLGNKTTTVTGSVFYQIGTRNAETVLRLEDGETQIIGGLINDEERTSIVKIPILGDIPIIGHLFSRHEKGTVKTDILLSITPHIVRSFEVPDEDKTEFLSGREDNPSFTYVESSLVESIEVDRNAGEFFKDDSDSMPPPPPPMIPGGMDFDEPGMMPPNRDRGGFGGRP